MLLSARKRLMEIELDLTSVAKFTKWVLEEYRESIYAEYFEYIWKDIERLMSQDEEQGITTFRYWVDLLEDFSELDFLIYCIKLRLVLLEVLFAETHEIFVAHVNSLEQTKVKEHLFTEIEKLLAKLEHEPDLAEVDKLRDRFDFLSSLIKTLD